ncbi:MAG TPA: hypothetical protein PK771_07135, partial [Spirochaetota bacterium]|nr:hypothetical protein [Spirochaetota bacterium]
MKSKISKTTDIERKIFFYTIEIKKDDEIIEPNIIFEHIKKLKFEHVEKDESESNYLTKNDTFLCMYCESSDFPISGRLGKKRVQDLPSIEEKGKKIPLLLEKEQGLIEETHFMIFKENIDGVDKYIIGVENNFYGPRPMTISKYLKDKSKKLTTSVLQTPLMKKDITEIVNRLDEISNFTIAFHKDLSYKLSQLNQNFSKAMNDLKNEIDYEFIEVSFKAKRKSSFMLGFKNKLAEWTKTNLSGIKKLKISGINSETEEYEKEDLLNQFIYSNKKVIKSDDKHRSVQSSSMYYAIKEAYEEEKEIILGILG